MKIKVERSLTKNQVKKIQQRLDTMHDDVMQIVQEQCRVADELTALSLNMCKLCELMGKRIDRLEEVKRW